MATRPGFIEIRSRSHGPIGSTEHPARPLPSPRLHVAGDVPPELSPLDAFAAQSRLLAKKLEESTYEGKRISRLPPFAIQNSLNAHPNYFRSASAHETRPTVADQPENLKPNFETEIDAEPSRRPLSIHPRMSKVPYMDAPLPLPSSKPADEEEFRGRRPLGLNSDLEIRREESPTSIDLDLNARTADALHSYFPVRPTTKHPRQNQDSSQTFFDSSKPNIETLAPPRSPFAHQPGSARTPSFDGSDEDYSPPTGLTILPNTRKLSSSSGLPHSPISPSVQPYQRSPSICSDLSSSARRLSRPAFNFSRPLSRASEPPFDLPSRQTSSDSQVFPTPEEATQSQLAMDNEILNEDSLELSAAPSYVYSKFSLPRGKIVQRNSRIFQENMPRAQFQWELDAIPDSNLQKHPNYAPILSSPPLTHSKSVGDISASGATIKAQDTNSGHHFSELDHRHPGFDRAGHDTKLSMLAQDKTRTEAFSSTRSITSGKSQPQSGSNPSQDGSAEWHVSKGIECHECGSLQESTYHLRVAARQNHPTGMLLYALACRHGWGMRPNQEEGVRWLRKAADFAILEVADDEDLLKGGKAVDIVDQKTRKAQFALSIYELGVSHLNGWGIEQDRVLALRCFEIAGGLLTIFQMLVLHTNVFMIAWGDGDALAEAGFCYAQGIGCKKDLKKSARFYRMAEKKGISMVGNSWYVLTNHAHNLFRSLADSYLRIYKSKYKDDEGSTHQALQKDKTTSPGKKAGKSQTRSLFGRKRINE
jgi:TPR repeat protein